MDTNARIRGKIVPELWNPHTGEISTPAYSYETVDSVDVTCVNITLEPIKSVFVVAKPF